MDSMLLARGLVKPIPFQQSIRSFSFFTLGWGDSLKRQQDGFQESLHTKRVPEFESDVNWKLIYSHFFFGCLDRKFRTKCFNLSG